MECAWSWSFSRVLRKQQWPRVTTAAKKSSSSTMDSAQSQFIHRVLAVVVVAVMAVVWFIPPFVRRAVACFSSSHSSRIRATSTRMRAVRSVVRAFISTSLHTEAGSFLMNLARRGLSTLAPTIRLCRITFHQPMVARVFLSQYRTTPGVRILKPPEASKQPRPGQASRRSHCLVPLNGWRLAGCRLWSRRSFLDR